jgi:hypothetical protein
MFDKLYFKGFQAFSATSHRQHPEITACDCSFTGSSKHNVIQKNRRAGNKNLDPLQASV